MGLIKCWKHGSQLVILCSEAIAKAVDETRFLRAHVLIDRWGQAGLVSDSERDEVVRATSAAQPWGWPDLTLEPAISARCELDVDEWLARTGQGTLADAIAGAKASLLVADLPTARLVGAPRGGQDVACEAQEIPLRLSQAPSR